MRRFGVILLLLFEAVWLNAFLPGHTRGVVKLADGGGCCEPKKCCEVQQAKTKNEKGKTGDRAGKCAVCFFAARLSNSPAFVIELPPPTLLDEAPIAVVGGVDSVRREGIFDPRGPPLV